MGLKNSSQICARWVLRLPATADVIQAFRQLSAMPTEVFLVVHLDGKNRMIGMSVKELGRSAVLAGFPPEDHQGASSAIPSPDYRCQPEEYNDTSRQRLKRWTFRAREARIQHRR